MIQPLLVFSDWGILILRMVLGLILIVHGWPKIKNLKQTAENFNSLGFKPGIFWGTIAALVEFFGGVFLIFGFLTQLTAFLVALEFLVIAIKVNWKNKFHGVSELDLLILAAALILMTLASGFLSIDHYFGIFVY